MIMQAFLKGLFLPLTFISFLEILRNPEYENLFPVKLKGAKIT